MTTITIDVATWLRELVSRQIVEVGHIEARAQAVMAWKALDQLDLILAKES